MDARLPALADQLLLIERELRLLGAWEQSPPPAQALASVQPFCVDTLSFNQWLQWVLLPRLAILLEQGGPLPGGSGIRPMAEESHRNSTQDVRQLLAVLGELDRLLGAAY